MNGRDTWIIGARKYTFKESFRIQLWEIDAPHRESRDPFPTSPDDRSNGDDLLGEIVIMGRNWLGPGNLRLVRPRTYTRVIENNTCANPYRYELTYTISYPNIFWDPWARTTTYPEGDVSDLEKFDEDGYKNKEAEAVKSQKVENMDDFKWPSFFDLDKARFLVQRVNDASSNRAEKRMFNAILRRAYEGTMELEILYRELPGVLADDRESTENFIRILERAAAQGTSYGDPQYDVISQYGSFDPSQCNLKYFIEPSILLFIREGIERISQGQPVAYSHYVNALIELWCQGIHINRLYTKALKGVDEDGRDRFSEELNLMTRDGRFEGHTANEDQPFDTNNDMVGMGGLMVDGNKGGEMPGTDGIWPPPADSGLLYWPPDPDGEPEFPRDFCEMAELWCVISTMGGLIPLPVSTNADGIGWISPSSACPGDTIIIHAAPGADFGASQQQYHQDDIVMVGTMPARVVSWSKKKIEIEVPPNSRGGCVGFRNETIERQRRDLYHQRRKMNSIDCLRGPGESFPKEPYIASSPPCTGMNELQNPVPRIERFHVNNRRSITVEPGASLTLTWQVSNATTIRIHKKSADGPDIDVTNPSGTSLDLGVFDEIPPQDATYELIATNCSTAVRRTVSVHLRMEPPADAGALSVRLLRPAANNQGQRSAVLDRQGEITLEIEFHPRADQSTFVAEFDSTSITNEFSGSGNRRTASISTSPGSHVLRLAAEMSPRALRAYYTLESTYNLTVCGTPYPFCDDFSRDGYLRCGYRWFDEDDPDTYEITGGRLQISVTFGQDLWSSQSSKTGAPLMLYPAPSGNYEVECVVDAKGSSNQQKINTQVGLFVYQDPQNWLFFGFTYHNERGGAQSSGDGLIVTSVLGDSANIRIYHSFSLDYSTLKILRSGDLWRFYYKDGGSWTKVGQFSAHLGNHEVGMGVKSFDYHGSEHNAYFDDFCIRPSPGVSP